VLCVSFELKISLNCALPPITHRLSPLYYIVQCHQTLSAALSQLRSSISQVAINHAWYAMHCENSETAQSSSATWYACNKLGMAANDREMWMDEVMTCVSTVNLVRHVRADVFMKAGNTEQAKLGKRILPNITLHEHAPLECHINYTIFVHVPKPTDCICMTQLASVFSLYT
jgi:hypothetical protein